MLCFLTSFQVQTFHVCHQKMGWMGPWSSDQFWPSWCNSESDWYINPSENGGMLIPELLANQSIILLVEFQKISEFHWVSQFMDYDHQTDWWLWPCFLTRKLMMTPWPRGSQTSGHLFVSENGGTAFIIHWKVGFSWIFHYKPSSYGGTPMAMETPIRLWLRRIPSDSRFRLLLIFAVMFCSCEACSACEGRCCCYVKKRCKRCSNGV